MKKVMSLVLAEFHSPSDLLSAANKVREKGYTSFDAYAPFPIHGIEDAVGMKPTPLGWIVLLGGTLGLTFAFSLQTWVSTRAYRLVISGKPLFSFPAFIPVMFELMVLFSAFFTVFGMFHLNKLPQHYHPLFKSKNFKKASSHGFFIAVESADPLFDKHQISTFLESIGGSNIEYIED